MWKRTYFLMLVAAVASALAGQRARAADSPQWGEAWSRNMVSSETGLPDSFSTSSNRNLKWTVRLGTETHSTPVVASGRVLIGTNNGDPRDSRRQGDRGVMLCLDEKTGGFLWQLVVPKLTNSIYWDWPRAGICSPATVEGTNVYLVSNRGEVMCLDLAGMANGNDGPFQDEARHATPADDEVVPVGPGDADIRWLFDLVRECGVRQHDSAYASVLVHGQYLYVNTSNGVDDSHKHIASPDAPSLVVLDKRTGRLVATDGERIGPRVFHSTWSSPSLTKVNGLTQVIFCGGNGVVYAFAPWEETSAAPGDVKSAGKLKKLWWFDCDPSGPKEEVHRFNGNRKESPSNIFGLPVVHRSRVFVAGGGDIWWGKHEAWLKCVDATKSGDITSSGQLWSYPLARHCLASPALHGGLAFIGDTGGKLHCVDAETGQPCWTHDVKGEVWASPLVADGKVYFATRLGDVLVFAATREKHLLSETRLGSAISGTPAAANGVLYFTTMSKLFAVETR